MPTLHVKIFGKNVSPNESTFTWNTYGLRFVVYNSATLIICNTRKVFAVHLTPTKIMLEPADGMSASTKLVGTMSLVLTDNSN